MVGFLLDLGTTPRPIILDRRPASGTTSGILSEPILDALQVNQWQVRQCGVLFARPLLIQQDQATRDKVVGHIAVGPQDTLRTPIFARCPGVNTDACRVMLRTLAGMEYFARTNAHFSGGIRFLRYGTALVRGSAYNVSSIRRTNV